MTASGIDARGHVADATDTANWSRYLLILTGGLVVLRLVVAAVTGLTYDEALLAVKAHDLRLSYFDHPPLASLLIAAVEGLSGNHSTVVVRLPAIVLFAGTTWLVFRIGSLLFSPLAGFCGAVALSLSPLFSFYFGAFAVTDAPMLFAIAAASLCLCHALFAERDGMGWWLGAGLFAGLALLSKSFSALLVMLGVLCFLLTTPRHRRWLAHPAPYLAALLALVTLTPVFIWNAQNGWINFLFPGGHPIAGDWSFQVSQNPWSFQPLHALSYLGIQALILMPATWLGLVAALVWGFTRGPRSEPTWLLAWLGGTPVVIFTLVHLLTAGRKGFHWAAPGYLLLFPLLGALIEQSIVRHRSAILWLLRLTVLTLAVAAIVLLSHLLTGWGQRLIPQFRERDPILADLASWDALANAVARHRPGGSSGTFLAGLRWEDCAKIEAEVAIPIGAPVLCLTPFPEIFAYLLDPRPFLGRDALIIARDNQDVAGVSPYFERIEPLERVVVRHFGTPARTFELYRAHTMRRIYPWPYGPYRPDKPSGTK